MFFGGGGRAYLGVNSGAGYFGEAYSYIVPITCPHNLFKKKKSHCFSIGEMRSLIL